MCPAPGNSMKGQPMAVAIWRPSATGRGMSCCPVMTTAGRVRRARSASASRRPKISRPRGTTASTSRSGSHSFSLARKLRRQIRRNRLDIGREEQRHDPIQHRIGERPAGRDGIEHREIAGPAGRRLGAEEGIEQGQRRDLLRHEQGELRPPHPADREPDHGEALDPQMVEQRQILAREIAQILGGRRHGARAAMAPEMRHDHAVMLRQRVDLRPPHLGIPEEAGAQHDHLALPGVERGHAGSHDVDRDRSFTRFQGCELPPRDALRRPARQAAAE